jgi:hypothetical protein
MGSGGGAAEGGGVRVEGPFWGLAWSEQRTGRSAPRDRKVRMMDRAVRTSGTGRSVWRTVWSAPLYWQVRMMDRAVRTMGPPGPHGGPTGPHYGTNRSAWWTERSALRDRRVRIGGPSGPHYRTARPAWRTDWSTLRDRLVPRMDRAVRPSRPASPLVDSTSPLVYRFGKTFTAQPTSAIMKVWREGESRSSYYRPRSGRSWRV